eukprot:SM007560S21905  [mRNA]  locus=s7560:92:726:+ [translate_table: standard]
MLVEPASSGGGGSGDDVCLSQAFSQVYLETPLHGIGDGGAGVDSPDDAAPADATAVDGGGSDVPWPNPASGPAADDRDDVLCSQDFFCTPDYITPREQQFAVDLSGPGKEPKHSHAFSPSRLTPQRAKRPRPDGLPAPA